ncbi:BTAD domain-containing putative transcriptional regulator [Geodermatophilus marinus]|uniref:BTAD domain-containing putative transcriptional regulator n=1 Tax=Geodermatophilus sp. LHW52908 TaxID=2303986 RepID=UPI000E3BC672|nr:BTAD domain-containing putative transcriptional regulator [Geodermatophilus sp. LHW52908]RFU21618.1 AfsR/SARP family transcriptional regulator [Geodermatophilus sp. LHW52908]
MSVTSFRVLGPVEVWRDGRPLAAQTPRHRAVLAALLVDAGRTVAVDVLADRVWSGQPPTAVSATLQAVISRLRRELEPDAGGAWTLLLTREPGYRLAVDPEDVDAVRFSRLVRTARELAARGDVAGARAAVAEGLGLWRGPAYADVAATFAVEEAERLEQARLDARELAAELDLRLGRHAELVDDLRELVRAEPLREGLRASLVLALYRAGRQAEALETYTEGRRLLADGLGVDPGRPLQELHERILRQDPGLAAPAPPAAPAPEPAPAPAPPAAPAAPAPPPLPVPLTTFVGRARELGVLDGALAAQRLVTLVGPGGSGKTRLALEAARRRTADAPPAALVELAGVEDPDLVATQVATVLGVSLTAGDPLAAVATALQDRPLLLLLDNCEHVVEAAAEVCAALLPRCPDLRVLATSREPLGLPGEAVLPCGPMPAGTPGSDAEQLFLDRARLAAPHLADPSPEELRQVRELCAALDGLPLAVELAAACLTTLPLAEVAGRVDDRFALLSGGRRTAHPHQRTLAATVQWSVDLLGPAELAVFRAVSVLPGGFGPDAVDAVAGPDVAGRTLELLRELVAKSLVELDHAAGRYRMLETLRQYAEQGLDAATGRLLRDRQAAFVLALTERLEPTLRRPEWTASARRLDAEQPGIRAALAHALATGQGETALRIGAALAWWWYRRGHVQEGRRWLAAALEATPDAAPQVRSGALLGDALLAYLSGDVPAIFARTDEIVTAAQDERDGVLALALVLRGFVRALLGRPDEEGAVTSDIARGIELAQASGIEWVQVEIAMTLGQFSRVAGDVDGALAHLDAAERLALDLGHSWAHSSVLWIRAKVLVDTGRPGAALADLWQMVDLTHREGDATGTLAGLLTAVGAAAAAGRHTDAAVLLGAVQASARLIGYDPLRMDPLDGQRYVAAARAGLDAAAYEAALAEGAGMDAGAACALVGRLAGEVPAPAVPA